MIITHACAALKQSDENFNSYSAHSAQQVFRTKSRTIVGLRIKNAVMQAPSKDLECKHELVQETIFCPDHNCKDLVFLFLLSIVIWECIIIIFHIPVTYL